VVSWSLRFDWSIAVSSDRRPVTLQDAIRNLSEAYPDQNGIIQKVEEGRDLPQPTPMIRPGASGASSKGRKSFEKLASIAQRKSDADGRKDTQ
jgi:hypothetical protein